MRTKNATRLKGQWGGGGLRMMPLPSPGFQIYIHYVLTIGGFFCCHLRSYISLIHCANLYYHTPTMNKSPAHNNMHRG